jgi:hypothetical protein
MATKKKIARKKSEAAELIVLIPSKWGLASEDKKRLMHALQPVVNSTIQTKYGPIEPVCGVTNGDGD